MYSVGREWGQRLNFLQAQRSCPCCCDRTTHRLDVQVLTIDSETKKLRRGGNFLLIWIKKMLTVENMLRKNIIQTTIKRYLDPLLQETPPLHHKKSGHRLVYIQKLNVLDNSPVTYLSNFPIDLLEFQLWWGNLGQHQQCRKPTNVSKPPELILVLTEYLLLLKTVTCLQSLLFPSLCMLWLSFPTRGVLLKDPCLMTKLLWQYTEGYITKIEKKKKW